MLNINGTEKGTSSLKAAVSQNSKNVFLGRRFIPKARTNTPTIIISAPAKLICAKVIFSTFLLIYKTVVVHVYILQQ